jgi:GNAT superfamily N-acetyltransferase
MAGEKQKAPKPSLGPAGDRQGEKLVDFLNLCYPDGWGSQEYWRWLYPRRPPSNRAKSLVIENHHRIIGHRGMHPGELVIRGRGVPVAFLGDTAIHPDYRNRGLYRRLHRASLQLARLEGACLALTLNSPGSTTHSHNKKTGFIEIGRAPVYLKVIDYARVFKGEVSAFLARRRGLRSELQGLSVGLSLHYDRAELSLDELLGGGNSDAPAGNKRGLARIIMSRDSLPWLAGLASGGRRQRAKCLIHLLFTGKMRLRFSSPLALAGAISAGMRVVKHA